MATTNTKKTFASFFKEAIIDVIKADNSLGDRSTYIGASDVGQCPLKCYLDKKNPDTNISPEQAIIFTRGHIAETLVKRGLDVKKIPYKYQVELEDNFIKVHLDFLFEKKEEIIVVELKTTNNIPDSPYESWVYQVQLQMHLVQKHYNKYTRGYIVVLNTTTGEIVNFEVQYNEQLAQIALQRAESLWNALQKNEAPEAEEQLYCSKCSYKEQCPVFKKNAEQLSAVLTKELQSQIQKIREIEAQEKALKAQKDALKAEIEEFMRATEKSKIDLGDSVVSLTKDTESVSLDTTKLKKEDPELFENLLEKYSKVSKRKGYIRIK